MEFKITKEFIIEAHGAACSDWKKRIESEFPEAFPRGLELGRWYTRERCENTFVFITTHITNDLYAGYGISEGSWCSDYRVCDGMYKCSPAAPEEVSAAIIAEAKKIGYKKGVTCVFGDAKDKRQLETDCFFFENNILYVKKKDLRNADIILKDGLWAEILPTEKTVVTREKALKILAKKLKVSPENIEIE